MVRYFGLDLHKKFLQVCVLDEGGSVLSQFRVETRHEDLSAFAQTLGPEDQVAMEACTFAWTVFDLVVPVAGRVVVANAHKVRVIAEAKIKTDKVDARVLAELLRADYLPGIWVPDAETRRIRALVAHRHSLVKRMISLKNAIHSQFHRRFLNCPHSDLFGKSGRRWLQENRVYLPEFEQRQLDSFLTILATVESERQWVETDLAKLAYRDQEARLLLTIPGVDYPVALALLAAIGDIRRFPTPEQLCAYLGLVPSVRQSGSREFYGRITKHGNAAARWMLVQAAHQLTRLCTPLRPFYERIRIKRGRQTAVVAVARKLATLAWHLLTRNEPYRYANARCIDKKFSRLHLRSGQPRRKSGPKPGKTEKNVVHLSGKTTFSRNLEEVHADWGLPALAPAPPGEQRHIQHLGGIEKFLTIK